MISDTYAGENPISIRTSVEANSTLGKSPSVPAWLLPASFYCLFAYVALLLLPAYYQAVIPGMDPSWGFALNHFVHTQFKFGPDLIFTYGPLGFVAMPQPANLMVGLAVKAAVWLVLLWQLAATWRSGRQFAAVVLVIGLIASNKVYFYYWDYLIAATILVVFVRMLLNQMDYGGLALLSVLMALAFLVKFTAFMMSASCLVVYSASLVRAGRCADGPQRIAATGAVFLAGPLAYLIYNPSLHGLFLYLKGAFSLASGYAAAMSLPTDSLNAKLGAIACAMFGGSAVYAVRRRRVTLRGAGIALVATWVAFRHGFVRSGPLHAAVFFSLAIFLFAVLLAQMDFRQRDTKMLTAVFIVFTVVAMFGIAERWHPQEVDWWSPKTNVTAPLDLLHWKRAINELDHRGDSLFSATVGNTYVAAVNGKRVLVFPWDLAYAAHGEFEVVPLYTIQAYSAYTRYLDRMSAQKILAFTPPLDDIIFEWKSIDDRNPNLDVPAVWNTLFANFVPQMRKNDSFLLAPRPVPLKFAYQPLSAAEYKPRLWVPVPRATVPVAMSIDLRPTLFGSVLTTLYKQEPVFLAVRTLSGNTAQFRVPVDVLATPTLINVLPLSFESVAELWTANSVKDPIVALRLLGKGLAHMRPARYSFYRVEGTSVAVADRSLTSPSDSSIGTLKTHFHLSSVAEIHNLLSGYFDRVDGSQIEHLNDPKLAVRVDVPLGCIIQGWVASGDFATARSMDEVYAVVDGVLVKAQIVPRPDVGEYFKNPALNNSGYRLYLDSTLLHPEVQAVELIGYTREDKKLYRFPGTLYLESQ
jgi:hypothetical protein